MRISQCLSILGGLMILVACEQTDDNNVGTNNATPKLLLSNRLQCQEPILPVFDARQSTADNPLTPVYLPLDMQVTGIAGKDLNQTKIELSYDPEAGQVGKFKSWDTFISNATPEDKEALLSSDDPCDNGFCSRDLKLNGSRIVDAFYCTKKGIALITANIATLPLGKGRLKSNSIEITCVDPAVYEERCAVQPDMDISEMGTNEMGAEPDLALDAEIKAPTRFSLIYDNASNENISDPISVQGSSQGLPTSKPIIFKVVNEDQVGVAGVKVKFILNWPGESCMPCDSIKDEESCNDRRFCEWTTGVIPGEGDMMVEQTGCFNKTDLEAGDDARCNNRGQRCEANICVDENRILPVSLIPTEGVSNADGLVKTTLVSSYEPGVFSVRAEATFGDAVQIANSPNITIKHGIPAQKGMSLICKHNVVPAFSTRIAPDAELSANRSGYALFNYQATECSVSLSDRFTGRISENVPVFLMTEGGSVNQNLLTDENGIATTPYQISDPPPLDVEPILMEAVTTVERPAPRPGEEAQLRFNPRDGLSRLIAFTQGDAHFIDLNADGFYQPTDDLVPVHEEPFVDANDNGVWDRGEPFYDVNRDQQWNADVFERPAAMLQELRTLENNVRTNPASVQLSAAIKLKNPSNLRTTIWTGFNILWTSDPGIQLDLSCANPNKCASAQNITACDTASQFDIYVDASNSPMDFVVRAQPKDANNNCLAPINGNNIKVELVSEFTDSASIVYASYADETANVSGMTDNDRLITNESCFDVNRPSMPLADAYRTRIILPNIEPVEGQPPAQPKMHLLIMSVTYTYQTFVNGEQVSLTRQIPFNVGLCR